MTLKNLILLCACVLPLVACDAAKEIAGDAIKTELRASIVAQCPQIAESAGIASARIAQVCECSADTLMADGSVTMADIDPARLESIINTCVAQTGPDAVAAPSAAPAE